jgi:hypothetical protein
MTDDNDEDGEREGWARVAQTKPRSRFCIRPYHQDPTGNISQATDCMNHHHLSIMVPMALSN